MSFIYSFAVFVVTRLCVCPVFFFHSSCVRLLSCFFDCGFVVWWGRSLWEESWQLKTKCQSFLHIPPAPTLPLTDYNASTRLHTITHNTSLPHDFSNYLQLYNFTRPHYMQLFQLFKTSFYPCNFFHLNYFHPKRYFDFGFKVNISNLRRKKKNFEPSEMFE